MKMELWIRSQDKKDLICTRRIYVHENTIRTNVYEAIGFAILGKYKTKERALEVLDEIQSILKPKYILDSSSIRPDDSWVENGIIMQKYNANVEIKELYTFVYEMPEN